MKRVNAAGSQGHQKHWRKLNIFTIPLAGLPPSTCPGQARGRNYSKRGFRARGACQQRLSFRQIHVHLSCRQNSFRMRHLRVRHGGILASCQWSSRRQLWQSLHPHPGAFARTLLVEAHIDTAVGMAVQRRC